MKYFKKIIKNRLLIRLIIICLVLFLSGFLFLKYFDAFLEAKFNLNTADFNIEYLNSKQSALDASIFNNQKFKLLKINKTLHSKGDISVKSNPFEDYREKGSDGQDDLLDF